MMHNLTIMLTSRAPLLLLVSYLLLRENVTSAPICVKRDGDTQKTLEKLFKLTTFMSQITRSQAAKMFTEFDKQYAQGKSYNDRFPDSCPTDSFDTPENKEQVLESNPEVLLNLISSLLYSWSDPLFHLVNEMSALQGDTYAILSKAREIQAKFEELRMGVKAILNKIGEKDNDTHVVWSGLPSLQSSNEDVRHFSFYNLIRCLLRDSHRVNTYFEVLKYRMIHQSNC
ncbi:prolactin-2B1-like [Mesocricetus auratus]|uniref:Prolactin-2B1-like n=1 Tax=Mesocricetus auratus TaxID=10036 RepID=A0A1U7Q788_MESAU|nr:prolactin-2B1-like [Mesocricetus auratus]